ncbi:hypothetical protein TH61_16615 [Rufibacter sp. DG15C]|uniref:hypothetical protein n=1 Tax=Rufibacter sp. DG15C TaxID=1379909 RepID=UPI00078DCBD7|nr:hypothetical protein [Rufibacter sp. DG15C]AMM52482.1 hypothetical protein TH61_16615 [Rufibacter sp. DG15C]
MLTKGWWTKDEEGFMEFETAQLQRLYEAITEQYHAVYEQHLHETQDEELAHENALQEGYEMVTNTKLINDEEEFATSYITPTFVLDIWYEKDAYTQKRVYDKGYLQVLKK